MLTLINIFIFSSFLPSAAAKNLIGILSFVAILSILILVHEAGHFFVAKRCGVKVEVFSLGFGRKILKRKINDTEYCLSLLPLGGYVKMTGDEPGEEIQGKAWEYLSQPPGKRAAIVFAGPLTNYLFAFLVFTLVFLAGKPSISTKIGQPRQDTPAAQAKLLPGDEIIAINNHNVRSWDEVTDTIRGSHELQKQFKIKRNGEISDIPVTARLEDTKDLLGRDIRVPRVGISPYLAPKIEGFTKDSPAQNAGLKKGDVIIAIDGQEVAEGLAIIDMVSKKQAMLKLTVIRDNEKIDFAVLPVLAAGEKENEKEGDIGVIFGQDITTVRYGLFGAVYQAGYDIIKITKLTYVSIGRLLIGKMSLKKAGTGPVGIAFISIEMATRGIIPLVLLLGMLSVSLALVNLLPFPVLDGGHILFLLVEKFRGKALSIKVQENINKIAIALLIALFLYVTWSDLEKFEIIDRVKKFFISLCRR